MDSNQAFCDYFAVVGLEWNGELRAKPYACNIEESTPSAAQHAHRSKPPLDSAYGAQVLSHFPRKRSDAPFSYEIAELAMPTGVVFRTKRSVPKKATFHPFVIVREDGAKVYGAALTYYEEIRDQRLRQHVYDLQTAHLKDVTATPEEANYAEVEAASTTGSPAKSVHHTNRQSKSKLGTRHSTNYYQGPTKALYVSKCLCLVMKIPIVFSSESLLRYIWRTLNAPIIKVPLEGILYWLLNEVPLPSPGMCVETTQHDSYHVAVRRPTEEELPFFDYPLQRLFCFISVDTFLKLFSCFMLERRILLCSRHPDRLMLIAESLSTLVFPFRWQLTYVPILPHCQWRFLQAPFNYLMGIIGSDERIPEQVFQLSACILDIDTGILVDYPEDVPTLPRHRELATNLSRLLQQASVTYGIDVSHQATGHSRSKRQGSSTKNPKHPVRQCSTSRGSGSMWSNMKRMSRSFDNSLTLEDDDKAGELLASDSASNDSTAAVADYLCSMRFNEAIRQLFTHYLATLFSTYQNFLLLGPGGEADEKQPNDSSIIHNLFDKVSFLSEQPGSHMLFLSAFLETQIFASFLDAKLLTNCVSPIERHAIDYFDRKIASLPPEGDSLPTDVGHIDLQDGLVPVHAFATDYEVLPPHRLKDRPPVPPPTEEGYCGVFPSYLEPKLFEAAATPSVGTSVLCSPWKQSVKKENKAVLDVLEGAACRLAASQNDLLLTPMGQTPMKVANQNWRFVEQLLKETKAKTKRMLVMKLGKEAALHLGHGDLGITGVEENTLVAGFCDLLERIWAHGLKKQSGTSPLWTMLYAHNEKDIKTNKGGSGTMQQVHPASIPLMATKQEHADRSVSGEEKDEEDVGGLPKENSAKILDNLLDSIRNIAKSFEDAKFEGDANSNPSTDATTRRAHMQSLLTPKGEDTSSPGKDEHWSKPLLGAAGLLRDKVNSNGDSVASHRVHPKPEGKVIPAKRDGSTARFYHHEDKAVQEKLASTKPPTPGQRGRKMNKKSTSHLQGASSRERVQMNGSTCGSKSSLTAKPPHYSFENAGHMEKLNHAFENFTGNWSSHALSTAAASPPIGEESSEVQCVQRPREFSLGNTSSEVGAVAPQVTPSRRSLSRPQSPMVTRQCQRPQRAHLYPHITPALFPLPGTMAYDLRNVMWLTEIKSDNGFARAFVRLALERKLLHTHLKALFSNHQLLQKMYKRHAFLRCEEEREQFLYHILSLTAVDFSCFTHTFINAKLRYEVLLVGSLDPYFSQAVWIMLTGSLGTTATVTFPSGTLQHTFEYKNLGLLSTVRIGYEAKRVENGPSKWFLDHVIVRNSVTGQMSQFSCGRWFGRGVDDGALERLLVAEALCEKGKIGPGEAGVGSDTSSSSLLNFPHLKGSLRSMGVKSRPESPVSGVLASPRRTNHQHYSSASLTSHKRTPSVGHSMDYIFAPKQNVPQITELQHKLGMCVNALVKHFLTDKDPLQSAAKLTPLLCGDDGLVACMEKLFELGRQDTLFSNRFFRQPYPWDYVEKVFKWFYEFFLNGESRKLNEHQRHIIIHAYGLVTRINANGGAGKEGKFNVFILLTLKAHILPGLLLLMAWTPITAQMYDESAILKQPHHLSYLSKLLSSLDEFNFTLEKSLTLGIDNP